MLFNGDFDTLFTLVKIVAVDLLLSGDNAVVIALACRGLPPRQSRQALLFGTGAAIVLRLVLTALLSVLLHLPLLKLVGAIALLAIAVALSVAAAAADEEIDDGGDPAQRLVAVVGMIVVADATMSLDNVVALAAVTHGSFLLLLLGLCLSIPLLISGSLAVTVLVNRYPALVTVGGVLLGWIAGDLAVSDPLVAGWVDREAFALAYATPLAGAIFVWAKSRMIAAERARRPARRRPPAPQPRARHRSMPVINTMAAVVPAVTMPTPTLDRYDRGERAAIPAPDLTIRPSGGGDRTAVFRYALIATVLVILVYVVNALGTTLTIIGRSIDHARPSGEASCPERVLAANRGVDPATLNRLVGQCRAQERAGE